MKNKVGIIGLGFGTQVHLPAFRSLGAEVVALCGTEKGKTEEYAKKSSVPRAYVNWEEMLEEEELDIISIATPPEVQEKILKVAADRKLTVFAEKPLGTDLALLKEIVREFEKRKILSAVDFEFASLGTFTKAKEILENASIERINVDWNVCTYANKQGMENWKTHPLNGGVLNLFGSHVLFNLEWFGGGIESFSAVLGKKPSDTRNTETQLRMNGKFLSGVSFSVNVDTHNDKSTSHCIELKAKNSSYLLKNESLDYISGFKLTQDKRVLGEEVRGRVDGRIEAVARVAAGLLGTSTSRTKSPNVVDGYRVQLLMHAVRTSSSSNGKQIEIADL